MKHSKLVAIIVCLLLSALLLTGCQDSTDPTLQIPNWNFKPIETTEPIGEDSITTESFSIGLTIQTPDWSSLPVETTEPIGEDCTTTETFSPVSSSNTNNADARENPLIGIWVETHYEKEGELFEENDYVQVTFSADGKYYFDDGNYKSSGIWLLQGDCLTLCSSNGYTQRHYVKELTYDKLVYTEKESADGASIHYQFISLPEDGTEAKEFLPSDIEGSWVDPQYGTTISFSANGAFSTWSGDGGDEYGNYSILQGNRLVTEISNNYTYQLITECNSDTLTILSYGREWDFIRQR